MNKPLQQNVPDLGNIESRDGARQAIKALHRYLRQYVSNADKFNSDLVSNLTPLVWAAPIASAATITPLQNVQPVTGNATVTTISTGASVGRVILLAVDGFDLATGGNIAGALTVAQGRAVSLYLNFSDNLWYPEG